MHLVVELEARLDLAGLAEGFLEYATIQFIERIRIDQVVALGARLGRPAEDVGLVERDPIDVNASIPDRDAVAGAFTWPTAVPVYDYAGDAGSLGNLVVERWDADRPVPTLDVRRGAGGEQELLQWNLVVALRWVEDWT